MRQLLMTGILMAAGLFAYGQVGSEMPQDVIPGGVVRAVMVTTNQFTCEPCERQKRMLEEASDLPYEIWYDKAPAGQRIYSYPTWFGLGANGTVAWRVDGTVSLEFLRSRLPADLPEDKPTAPAIGFTLEQSQVADTTKDAVNRDELRRIIELLEADRTRLDTRIKQLKALLE